jgi:hypothetical protein
MNKLLYEADAEKDFHFPVPFFSSIERKGIPLKERALQLQKISDYFVEEVKRRLRLMNVFEAEVYIYFESRSNNWTCKEILEWDGDFPGKSKK